MTRSYIEHKDVVGIEVITSFIYKPEAKDYDTVLKYKLRAERTDPNKHGYFSHQRLPGYKAKHRHSWAQSRLGRLLGPKR
jgi:hypothetical protein